jgi:hypothetical protein
MDVAAGWRNRPKVVKGPALSDGGVVGPAVVLVRLVVNSAGLAVARRLCILARQLRLVREPPK